MQLLVEELLSGSNTAFNMYPGLAFGAAEVIALFGTPEQTALSTGINLALDEESWKFEVQTNWSFRDDRVRLVAGASYRDDDIDSADENARARPRAFSGPSKATRQTLLFEPLRHDFQALFAQADWWINERLKLVVGTELTVGVDIAPLQAGERASP